jgi:hypothetical protein
MGQEQIRTFQEFWPVYVEQHLRPINRSFHALGMTAVFFVFGHLLLVAPGILDTVVGWYWLTLVAAVHTCGAVVIGYGCMWIGHRFERTSSFAGTHPLWSLHAALHMYRLMAEGAMTAEVERLFPGGQLQSRGRVIPFRKTNRTPAE